MSVRASKHEIFNAAAELPREERAAFLDRECGGDAALRAEVEELLRHDADAGSFLEGPAAPGPPLESPGTTIGPYKLLEQIGEGGFGVVFMAEQAQPVRRRVALKILKPGMDTKQVIARFEAERQALALMDHPNIARVLDAGTTGTGRPFFVMELVRGVPITEYCDAHRLTPRQRLELFVTVCHAVQHAHQKGIIHRDLKPSNVLVALHDDRPVAKVIDFGIAKATSGPLTDKTVFTAFQQMIGTPLYMSPEQASSALDVDTRSDVYSLGVLLYELLTGTTPFDQARLKDAAFDEIRRIVREEEPATPSARLSTSETLPSVAANRGTEPAKLTRLVRGELDWIAMKALEKDRTRRYDTANGLAMDVQRYLADEAVSACPPSAGYRLRKLVRRNRRALVVAALLVALLLVVAGSVGWMARDGAARRARTAEAVAGLLDRCEDALRAEQTDQAELALESAERRAAEGGAEGLEGRLARYRADLKLLRDLDAIDTFSWTWTHDKRPSLEEMAARWRAALAGYGVAPDEGRAGDAAALVNGSLVRERALTALDRWLAFEASAGLRAVLRTADPDPYREAVRDAIAARDAPAVIALAGRPEALAQPAWFASALGTLGDVPPFLDLPASRQRAVMESALLRRPGDLTLLMGLGLSYPAPLSAVPVQGSSNQERARPPGVSERLQWFQAAVAAHPRSVPARNNLGVAYCDDGDLDRGIVCFREAIRLDPTFVKGRCNLAEMFSAKGDLDAAITCLEEAIRIDPSYADAYLILGSTLGLKREWDRAIFCLKEAIRLDPTSVGAHKALGDVLSEKGELDRAIACYEEAIRLYPNFAETHYSLGNAFCAKGEMDHGIACFREAIRLAPGFTWAYVNLGVALACKGEWDQAMGCHREAIRLDATNARAHNHLGSCLNAKGEPDEAIALYKEAIRLDPSYAFAHHNLGNALRAKGDPEGAIACYREAIRHNPSFVVAHIDLGVALAAKGKADEAIACFEDAIRLDAMSAIAHLGLAKARLSSGDPDRAVLSYAEAIRLGANGAEAHYGMGMALAQKRDLVGAVAAYRKAIEVNPGYAEAHCNLGAALQELGRFAEAVEHRRKGHELGSRRPGWRYPSDTWVQEAERLLVLDGRLPQVLAGHAAAPDEQLALAQFCTRFKKRHVDAVALYGPAFAAEPALAEQTDRPRYEAACAAALAAAGHGVGAETLGASDKARLRGQALDWLRAEFTALGDIPAGDPGVAERVRTSLQRWLDDANLGGVRDAELADLPADERERWTMLWNDVRDLIARMAPR